MKIIPFTEPNPRLDYDCGIIAFCILLSVTHHMTIDYNAAGDMLKTNGIYNPERGCSDRKLAASIREYTGCNNRLRDTKLGLTVREYEEKNPNWTGLLVCKTKDDVYHAVAMFAGKTYNSIKSDRVVARMAINKNGRALSETRQFDLLLMANDEMLTTR